MTNSAIAPVITTPALPVKLPLEISNPKTPIPPKKIYEYKSICSDEKKTVAKITDTLKEKRVTFLGKKLETYRAEKKNTSEIILKIISEFLLYHDLKKAEDFLKKESLGLSERDQVIAKAKIDIENKLFQSAKKALNNYLVNFPNAAPVLALLIEVNIHLKNYSDAYLAAFDLKKLEAKIDHSLLLCRLSALDSNHSQTQELCDLAAQKSPDSPFPAIYKGISERDQEEYAKAVLEFKKSILKKETEFGLTCLAESFMLSKNIDDAILNFKRATEIDPLADRAWIGLAQAYLKKSLYIEALDSFKISCDISDNSRIEILKIGAELKIKKLEIADLYFTTGQHCGNHGKFK